MDKSRGRKWGFWAVWIFPDLELKALGLATPEPAHKQAKAEALQWFLYSSLL